MIEYQIVCVWWWFAERFEKVADEVFAIVFKAHLKNETYQTHRWRWKQEAEAMFADPQLHETEPGSLFMQDGEWVARELYDAVWERLRRLKRETDWESFALHEQMALVFGVLYETFRRCAWLRGCDYLGAPAPSEEPFEWSDAMDRRWRIDFSDIQPVKTYGPMP